MMQNISKKSPQIAEVDDAFHCDDGTMRVFLAILSPSWGAGWPGRGGSAGERRVWGANSKISRVFESSPLKYNLHLAAIPNSFTMLKCKYININIL